MELRRALQKVDYNVNLSSCLQLNKLQNDDSLSKTWSDDRKPRYSVPACAWKMLSLYTQLHFVFIKTA